MRVGEEKKSRQVAQSDCVKWEYRVRVFFFFFFFNLYIYGGILVFLTYIYKWVGFGSEFRFLQKPGLDPDPLQVFCIKLILDPIIYRGR